MSHRWSVSVVRQILQGSNRRFLLTRHANDFHIVVHRTSLLKSTIRSAGPVLWNSLDAKLKSSKSIYCFKRII